MELKHVLTYANHVIIIKRIKITLIKTHLYYFCFKDEIDISYGSDANFGGEDLISEVLESKPNKQKSQVWKDQGRTNHLVSQALKNLSIQDKTQGADEKWKKQGQKNVHVTQALEAMALQVQYVICQ